ncbi:MAG: 3-phosphoshikimate 1-carboxyvinyltransferase [Actinomycetota bacterium]
MSGSQPHSVTPLRAQLNTTVRVPGSKSVAARALVCAALATGKSSVSNLPTGDDTVSMLAGLSLLGAQIETHGNTAEFASGIDVDQASSIVVDARLAGTTARFLTAVSALRAGEVVITGEDSLRKRPMHDLHQALSDIGLDVSPLNGAGVLPVAVKRGEQKSERIRIAAITSSQFTTALMLIAPKLSRGLAIVTEGEVVSQSYIEMTIGVQHSFGVTPIEHGEHIFRYDSGDYVGAQYEVEPDASSASYPLAAAAIAGGRVVVSGLGRSSLQGDAKFADVLVRMGCSIEVVGDDVVLSRPQDRLLQGVTIDMRDMSDLVPSLAVVAAFAQTATTINGVGFIRKKESDRIGDLAHELRELGVQVDELADGLTVHPSKPHGGIVNTHHDHRLAMSLALIGLVTPGVVINDPMVVTKSWPEYWTMLGALQ